MTRVHPPAAEAPAVLVCFALKEEAAAFVPPVRAGRPAAEVLVTGMGRVNAAARFHAWRAGGAGGVARRPALVLTCGFAGGLAPGLRPGAVRFETGDATLRQRLLAAGLQPAVFACTDRILATAREKQAFHAQSGADLVEMESAAIQAACRETGIPCATVRVVSDAADEDLPLDFNALTRPDQTLDMGKLLLAIARSPGVVPGLIRLRQKTRRAARELAAALERIISA